MPAKLYKRKHYQIIKKVEMADELIQKFVEQHDQTEKLLNEDKLKEAKQKYLEVVDTYHAIQKSQLENFHKELAYDQVTKLFKRVNAAKERVKVPYHLIAAAVLLIAFSLIIFLKPSIVGLAGLENILRQPVDMTFTESGLKPLTLKERPLSLMASGEFKGPVKLYYKKGEKLELIMDSNKIEGNTFKDVCVETCDLVTQSNSIELFAQIEEGSTLKLIEIAYKVQIKENTAPSWKGPTRIFNAQKGKPLILNLDEQFTDSEEDELVYLSTTEEGTDVTIQENQVTITAKTPGTKHIVLVASDLREITRIPITVEVK